MCEDLELTVESDLNNLAQIGEFVTRAALCLGLDGQQAFEVQMATDEACTNIVEHAYGIGVAGEINIRCTLEGEDFVVALRDHGRSFDPEQVAEPNLACPLEERQIGGLGLYFMRKLMDRIVFRFDPVMGNELRMYKRRHR